MTKRPRYETSFWGEIDQMGGKSNLKIAVVIPVYNEKDRAVETIKLVLEKMRKGDVVVVVDDGSSDKSLKLLKSNFSGNKRVYILSHIMNLGKGAAMKTGTEFAWKLKVSGVIFIDSDGQHNPKYLPMFRKALRNNNLVFGYRDFGGQMPYVRKWGNKVAVVLVRRLFNVKRKDLLCGFFGFRKKVYKKIYWGSSRYGVETEIATRVGKNKLEFSEIKVDTIYIDKYKGVNMIDALKILFNIPFWFFRK